jgi:peptide/nickel transport system substrate-binding protein
VAVELEANPDFYAGRPRIDRVVLRFAAGADVAELLAGNADIRAWPASPAAIQALGGDERFRVYPLVNEGKKALWWNNRSPFFSDVRVRRALSMAIDRTQLVAVNALPAEPMIAWDVPGTARQVKRGDLLPPLPYDPAHSRALLDTAGWRDENGDGLRERRGIEFRFTALMEPGDRSAVVVKEQLRRVGVEMELAAMEFSVVRNRMEAGTFAAVFHRFPGNFYADWFKASSVIGYHNPHFAQLWTEALETWNPEERDRMYRRAMPVFQTDMPVTILFYDTGSVIAHRRVHGLGLNHNSPLMYMDELWIEGDENEVGR